jgi:hypothetical protein
MTSVPPPQSKITRATLLAALFLFAPALWAQPDSSTTFTSPDGAFTFRHSNELIRCEKNGSSWHPPESCVAYLPVCDEDLGVNQKSIACFAYPRNRFTNTKAFAAATFSVEVLNQIATEKDCLASPSNASKQRPNPAKIQGVSFAVFDVNDSAMNQSLNGHVYRTFHQGKCYQLGINVATANPDVFNPPARILTNDDLQEINRLLEQARDSFQFLK